MSLLSLILDEPVCLFDQNFGLGLLNDALHAQPVLTVSGYRRPWRHLTRQQSGVSSLNNDKDAFQVNLDVPQFTPEEVSVKAVEGEAGCSCLVVEGKHEERQDEHGFISRHFVRRYVLPQDVDADKIQCKLSSDGVLNVTVPKKVTKADESGERVIPITQTGEPAVKKPSSTATTAAVKKQEEQNSEANP